MTVWVLHLPLSESETESIKERSTLPLPLEGLPDLSLIGSATEFRHLLVALHTDAPPETIERIFQRTWHIFSEVQAGDIIAVPLKSKQRVAVAEVMGRYTYQTDSDGADIHTVPVKWYGRTIPFARFRLHKQLLSGRAWQMMEVTAPDARAIIRSKLPHSYNRFTGIKWILGLFMVWHLIRMLAR
jgi:predicted Mrr-cat superfamily restriction endonuclease